MKALFAVAVAAQAVSGFTSSLNNGNTRSSARFMIEDPSAYTSVESKVDIAPPTMAEPTEEPKPATDSNAFFASPEADSSMDIQMASTTATNTRKVAVFSNDNDGNGIMTETNKPFPTVHAAQPPLVVSPEKAVLKSQGIMMSSSPDKAVPKSKAIGKGEPAESSTTVPNASTFKWRAAALDGTKVQWQQREIDCMIQPAE